MRYQHLFCRCIRDLCGRRAVVRWSGLERLEARQLLSGVHFSGGQVLDSGVDYAACVSIGDLNGDGRPDVLAAGYGDNTLRWYANAGAGRFGSVRLIADDAAGAAQLIAADVDGDGDADVVAVSASDDRIAWYENTDGLGTFGVRQTVSTAADYATSVAVADVDGDGDLDLLSSSRDDNRIAWYENTDGAGSFGAQQTISTEAYGAFRVATGDVDGDGDVDVLSASWSDRKFAWYENTDGAGSFGAQQVIANDRDFALDIGVYDLDGDGDLDVLGSSRNDDTVVWYANTDGAGTFGAGRVVSTSADGSDRVVAADIDGDGDLDIVGGSLEDHTIGWYENTDGAGTFGDRQVISATMDTAHDVTVGDLDGDGDLDVVGAAAGTDTIRWFAGYRRSVVSVVDATVAEDAPVGTVVGRVMGNSDNPVEADSYTITAGNDDGRWAIDSVGQLKVAGALDYETATSYQLTIELSDGISTDTAVVNIAIGDVNEFEPVFGATEYAFDVDADAEAGAVLGSVSATDADGSDQPVYAMVSGNDAGLFELDTANGQLTVADGATFDPMQTGTCTLVLSASDGVRRVTTEAVVSVNDVVPGSSMPAVVSRWVVGNGGGETLIHYTRPDGIDGSQVMLMARKAGDSQWRTVHYMPRSRWFAMQVHDLYGWWTDDETVELRMRYVDDTGRVTGTYAAGRLILNGTEHQNY